MLSLYQQPDPLTSGLALTCLGVVNGLYSCCPFTPPPPPPKSLPGLVQGKGGWCKVDLCATWLVLLWSVLVAWGSPTPGLEGGAKAFSPRHVIHFLNAPPWISSLLFIQACLAMPPLNRCCRVMSSSNFLGNYHPIIVDFGAPAEFYKTAGVPSNIWCICKLFMSMWQVKLHVKLHVK